MGLTACQAVERQPPPPVWRYVALGDSVAAGSRAETSYPRELARSLTSDGVARVRLQSLARGGQESGELLEQIRGSRAMRRAVAEADLLTITVGANDLVAMHRRFRSKTCGPDLECYRHEANAFVGRWEAILDEIASLRRPGVPVRTTNYYDPYIGNPQQQWEDLRARYPEGARTIVELLNNSICSLAEARGFRCADLYHAFNGPDGTESPLEKGLLAPDGFHPSPEGHRLIAERIRALGFRA
ncbi:MAG TPA: SGNH/GDSL hydrolase family protein [Actinomycetota bacterium]|nr:SGNH/GDSL hydrolase family protein [Actinomycetota bacterium]